MSYLSLWLVFLQCFLMAFTTSGQEKLGHQPDSVRIEIKGEDGQSASGAVVTVRFEMDESAVGEISPKLTLLRGEAVAKPAKTGIYIADEDGILEATLPVGAHELRFDVYNKSLGTGMATWKTGDERSVQLNLELLRCRGRVVDEKGNPIFGARLEIVHLKYSEKMPDATCHSDELGNWEMKTARKEVLVRVSHPEYQAARFRWTDKLDLQPVVLKRGHVIGGRVVGTGGEAFKGAKVVLSGLKQDDVQIPGKPAKRVRPAEGRPIAYQFSQETGENGEYKFRCVAPGLVRLQVLASGYAAQSEDINFSDGDENVIFRLVKAEPLICKVVDWKNEPATQCHAILHSIQSRKFGELPPVFSAKTDESGQVEFDSPPSGTVAVELRPDVTGAEVLFRKIDRSERINHFTLSPFQIVMGKVVDSETRRSISDFDYRLVVMDEGSSSQPGPRTRRPFSSGRLLHSREKEIDKPFRVEIWSPGYGVSSTERFESQAAELDFEIGLTRLPNTFRVLQPDGAPATGAQISIGIHDQEVEVLNGSLLRNPERHDFEADDSGNFKLSDQEIGELFSNQFRDKYSNAMIVHESGYAFYMLSPWNEGMFKSFVMTRHARELPRLIKLRPWSKVIATTHFKPRYRNNLVFAESVLASSAPHGKDVVVRNNAELDDGRFELSYLPDSPVEIQYAVQQIGSNKYGALLKFDQPTVLELGGDGVTVKGRAVVGERVAASLIAGRAVLKLEAPSTKAPGIPGWHRNTPFSNFISAAKNDSRLQLYLKWSERFFCRTIHLSKLGKDGSFEFFDVEPGEKVLSIKLDGSLLILDSKRLSVPKGDEPNRVVDLGQIEFR